MIRRLHWTWSIPTLFVIFFLGVGIGAVPVAPTRLFEFLYERLFVLNSTVIDSMDYHIVSQIRLPRVSLSLLIGAGLAVSGSAMQRILRNPLVDASLIGISAGASFFAALFLLFGSLITWWSAWLQEFSLSMFAFIGAILSALLVLRFSKHSGQLSGSMLILSGVALNAIAGALTGILIYLSDDATLRNITFWTMGSLGGASWDKVLLLLPLIGCPIFMIAQKSKEINVLALGENAAHHLGVSVKNTKIWVIIAVTLMVGSSVAFSGIIGFVGLVVPHIARFMVGSDFRRVLPLSAILGAALLTLADLISRTIVAPTEVPIGIITALMGSPFFLYLLRRNKKLLR
jgi:iron complex transport system permease protein